MSGTPRGATGTTRASQDRITRIQWLRAESVQAEEDMQRLVQLVTTHRLTRTRRGSADDTDTWDLIAAVKRREDQ